MLLLLAAVAFIQSVVSQCNCGGGNINLPPISNCGGNINLPSISNYGSSINLSPISNCGSDFIQNYQTTPTQGYSSTFSVYSNSPPTGYPGGISVTSENQIGGQLSVTGAMPFVGETWFEGNLASNGEASLSYGVGSGVALNGGGCGGSSSIGGSTGGIGYGSIGSSGYSLGGLSQVGGCSLGGLSQVGGVSSGGYGGSCGCY